MDISDIKQKSLQFVFENWKLLLCMNFAFYFYFYYTRSFNHFKKRNIKFKKPIILFGNTLSRLMAKKSFFEYQLEIYDLFRGQRFGGK